MRLVLTTLLCLFSTCAAAQADKWKHGEAIDVGAAITRNVTLDAESYLRVTPSSIRVELLEGENAYEVSDWIRLPAGDYRLRVSADPAAKGTLELKAFAGIDPHETDFDQWRFARPVEFAKPVEVVLFPRTDVDYLEVSVNHPGVVELQWSAAAGRVKDQFACHWLTSTGETVDGTPEGRAALGPGVWLLAVACAGATLDEPLKLGLSLKFTQDAPDRSGSGPETALPAEIGKPVSCSLRDGRDAVWYLFSAPRDGDVLVEQVGVQAGKGVPVMVEQSDARPCTADGGGYCVQKGLCWLRVGPTGSGAKQVSIRLHFLEDATEPNAKLSVDSLSPGTTARLWLPTTDDIDSYRVELLEDAALWVDLRSENGTPAAVEVTWLGEGGAPFKREHHEMLKAGKYTLRLKRADGGGLVMQQFTAWLRPYIARKDALRPLSEAPKLEPGVRKAFHIDPDTAGTTLQFELGADGTVLLDLETAVDCEASSLDYVAFIVREDGTRVPVNGGAPVALAKGTYRLLIVLAENSRQKAGLARVTPLDDTTSVIPERR